MASLINLPFVTDENFLMAWPIWPSLLAHNTFSLALQSRFFMYFDIYFLRNSGESRDKICIILLITLSNTELKKLAKSVKLFTRR